MKSAGPMLVIVPLCHIGICRILLYIIFIKHMIIIQSEIAYLFTNMIGSCGLPSLYILNSYYKKGEK